MFLIIVGSAIIVLFGILCGAYIGHFWATHKFDKADWKWRAIRAEKAWESHGLHCCSSDYCKNFARVRELETQLNRLNALVKPETACDRKKLQGLYAEVTHAILDAERDAEPDRDKYLRISRLESTIAHIVAPGSQEGAIARTGAISAAMTARQPMRALRLIAAYGVGNLDHLEEFVGENPDWRPVSPPSGLGLLLPF